MSMRATSGISKAAKCAAPIAAAYTIATFGADDDTFSVASGSSAALVGVFQSTTANAGDIVEVMVTGISNIACGGSITRGDYLTADTNGNGITAAPAAGVNANVIGVALESGVSGDMIAVRLAPGRIQG